MIIQRSCWSRRIVGSFTVGGVISLSNTQRNTAESDFMLWFPKIFFCEKAILPQTVISYNKKEFLKALMSGSRLSSNFGAHFRMQDSHRVSGWKLGSLQSLEGTSSSNYWDSKVLFHGSMERGGQKILTNRMEFALLERLKLGFAHSPYIASLTLYHCGDLGQKRTVMIEGLEITYFLVPKQWRWKITAAL